MDTKIRVVQTHQAVHTIPFGLWKCLGKRVGVGYTASQRQHHRGTAQNQQTYSQSLHRKALAAATRPIDTAASAEAAEVELKAFAAGAWGQRFPTVVASWRRAWTDVFFTCCMYRYRTELCLTHQLG